jgi:hypothetical protein
MARRSGRAAVPDRAADVTRRARRTSASMFLGFYGYYLIGIVAFIGSLAIQGWLKNTYAT